MPHTKRPSEKLEAEGAPPEKNEKMTLCVDVPELTEAEDALVKAMGEATELRNKEKNKNTYPVNLLCFH